MKEIAEPEIGQFHDSQFLEKDDVFRFEITMNHVQLVTVVDGLENL